ncbi:hypothetical protein HMP0721_0393 [Pseudoramibacter alactolyticus ATCC 23263]|uniref:Uncharacterized protein n=1 Tax=Pseudoramibacter alactolyticus ATCC 23263 TaxID=887929 RepID=E6MEG0_9FIRM|nr:hypothetical protein HMP0721_0393 [Pseudoramibacter alactolyticus ATCC 23263]
MFIFKGCLGVNDIITGTGHFVVVFLTRGTDRLIFIGDSLLIKSRGILFSGRMSMVFKKFRGNTGDIDTRCRRRGDRLFQLKQRTDRLMPIWRLRFCRPNCNKFLSCHNPSEIAIKSILECF